MLKGRRLIAMSRLVLLTLALSCLTPGVAFAQEPETRANVDRKAREEKAAQTKAYEPNRFERALNFAERKSYFLGDREGLYPEARIPHRRQRLCLRCRLSQPEVVRAPSRPGLWGAASIRRYTAAEARLTFPRLAGNRLHLETWASRRDYPQEDFYGLGPDSNRADRSDYAIRTNHFGGRVGVRPAGVALVGGGLEYLQPRLGSGKDTRFPNVTDVFGPAERPGINSRANFLRSDAFVEIDYRVPRNARAVVGTASTCLATTIARRDTSPSLASTPTSAVHRLSRRAPRHCHARSSRPRMPAPARPYRFT